MTSEHVTVIQNRLEPRVLSALMRAAQSGDTAAYAKLLHTLAPWLHFYVRRRRPFLQHADVEDLVQEIVLSLHAVRRTYDPERPFLPWLVAIAQNRLADGGRRDAARRASGEMGGADITSLRELPNAEREPFADSATLQRAIAALPSGQRAALEMLKLRELSLKEAAREVGTSVGALKVAVHRAMTSLRRSLTGKMASGG